MARSELGAVRISYSDQRRGVFSGYSEEALRNKKEVPEDTEIPRNEIAVRTN